MLLEREIKVLEQSNDMIAIHRAQGALTAYSRIKRLRDHVNATSNGNV